jgi:hypothetical protein
VVKDFSVDKADADVAKSRILRRNDDRAGIDNSPDEAEGGLPWELSSLIQNT